MTSRAESIAREMSVDPVATPQFEEGDTLGMPPRFEFAGMVVHGDFSWGQPVMIVRCPPGHELVQCQIGFLNAPPKGSSLAGILRVGFCEWSLSNGKDWEFKRAEGLPPEAPIEQDVALARLIGKNLRITRAPDSWSDCVDQEVTTESVRSDMALQAGALVSFRVRHHGDEVVVGLGRANALLWGFEEVPAPPLRRSREVYDHESFVADLDAAVKEIRDLLVQKNQAYGNSALDPVRIFSKASNMEQLFVRIDDKLSRLKRGSAAGEDVVKDLQGYLLLVRIAQMRTERETT